MDELVGNLLAAYRRRITALDWMSEETKQRALGQARQVQPEDRLPGEVARLLRARLQRRRPARQLPRGVRVRATTASWRKLGAPVDRDEWFMTPQTVNAYYNPGMNEIFFPAAILQTPFFDAEADDAANYGGIGAVIGHEIGHGFDDQGAKYDGAGNLHDWWTDADRGRVRSRTKALIEQYDGFAPRDLPGEHVNGALTVGENIGDLGGLTIALLAYPISLGGKEAPGIDGLTGAQRVFFGWAQVWRTKSRDAEAIRRLAIDPHSPPEFRCNGVVATSTSSTRPSTSPRRPVVLGARTPGADLLELMAIGTCLHIASMSAAPADLPPVRAAGRCGDRWRAAKRSGGCRNGRLVSWQASSSRRMCVTEFKTMVCLAD